MLPFLGLFGRDLLYYIDIGKGVLAGAPYATFGSYYPPATTLLFSLLAWLPGVPAYFAWVLVNLAMLVHLFRGRRALAWVGFFPFLHMVVTGNLDFILVWAAQWLNRKDWKSVVAALVLTLKPQIAFIILPYWLWQWANRDRRKLLKFSGLAALLHGIPVLLRPGIYGEWIAAVRLYAANPDNAGGSPSIFWMAKARPDIGWVMGMLIVVFAGLIIGGSIILFWNEAATRGLFAAILPAGHSYDFVALVDCAPAWLLVPLSWLAAWVSLRTGLPAFLLLPLAVIVYHKILDWRWERRFRREWLHYPPRASDDKTDSINGRCWPTGRRLHRIVRYAPAADGTYEVMYVSLGPAYYTGAGTPAVD